jgi:hypothetical protein
MAKGRRAIMTQEMYDAIPGLIAAGVSKIEIAQRYGMTPSSLVVQCSRRGISLSKHGCGRLPARSLRLLPEVPLDLEQPVLGKLREKARHLGTNEVELIKQLLRTIVFDDLYDAVLDSEPA